MSKTLPISKLKEQYAFVCNEYARKFTNKQGYDFSGWIADEVGGIAVFIDEYYFSLSEIIYDIDNKCPKGLIFKYQDYNIKNQKKGWLNYQSFAKGFRHTTTNFRPRS